MELSDIISIDNIYILDNPATEKKQLISDLAGYTLHGYESLKGQLTTALLEREKSMSTGIGSGVALPHCSSDSIHKVIGSLAVLKKPVDFEAIDDSPVNLIITLFLPKNKFQKHIQTLAAVARAFNVESFRNEIINATSESEIYEVLKQKM